MGYRIKLLAISKIDDQKLQARVHPCLLPLEHPLAEVNGVYNGIFLTGQLIDDMMFYGKGAGEKPTAVAVISDIVDIARNIRADCARRIPSVSEQLQQRRQVAMDDMECRYYFRFNVIDRPGVLAKISEILGDNQISISAVMQKERHIEDVVPVIIMTHLAREAAVRKALGIIDKLDVVKDKTVMIRIEAEA